MAFENGCQITQEKIKQLEKDLNEMECDLHEQYCEIGKSILEVMEQENKKINSLVDQIIEIRQMLVEAKKEEHEL